MDSVALTLAQRLISLRILAVPPSSRREDFYLRYVRPVVEKVLFRPDPVPASAQATPPQVQSMPRGLPLRHGDAKEILIIKTDHIGDFLLSLPAFSILRKGFPSARITLLCGSWIKDFALQSELFDRVVCANISSEVSSERTPPFDLNVLKTYHFPIFDIAIDLRVDPDSRFLLDHVSARLKAGFECDHVALDFAHRAPSWNLCGKPNHARHTLTLLANFADAIVSLFNAEHAANDALQTYIRSGTLRLTRSGTGPLIGISTRTGAKTRDWPLENYVSVIQGLVLQYDATIILLGSKHQKADGDKIKDETATIAGNVVNLIGKIPLAELPHAVNQLDLYIGGDTGGTHLAAMLGRKTLCLHAGVTPLEHFGPVGPDVVVLKCINLPCSPCGLTRLARCANEHQCMRSITPERVMQEIDTMLAERPGDPQVHHQPKSLSRPAGEVVQPASRERTRSENSHRYSDL